MRPSDLMCLMKKAGNCFITFFFLMLISILSYSRWNCIVVYVFLTIELSFSLSLSIHHPDRQCFGLSSRVYCTVSSSASCYTAICVNFFPLSEVGLLVDIVVVFSCKLFMFDLYLVLALTTYDQVITFTHTHQMQTNLVVHICL